LLNKSIELLRYNLVNDCHEALKLRSGSKWIKISLNEANIGLDNGANILDPMSLRIFVLLNISKLEVFDIRLYHV